MQIRLLFVLLAFEITGSKYLVAAPLELSEVVRQAVDTHPDINAAWQDLKIARQNTGIASAGYRPSVDVTARSSLVRRNYGLDQSYSDSEARLTVTQMLFDGFFTSSEVKRLESAQKVRYLELLNQVEQVSLEVANAYADVLLYRELLRVAEDNLRTHVDVYKQIEKSAQAGVARRADLEQISGRLYLAESNVMTEQSNLHDVSSRYQRLTGNRPPAELADIDKLLSAQLPMSVDEGLMIAYQYNPGFLATWYNINSNQFAIDSAYSRYMPSVNLVGSYGTQTRDQAGLDNTITEARVGLEINYNLYNGGADRAQIKASLAQKDRALNLRDRSCRDIRQTVQIAFNDIRNLERQLPALNEHRLSSSRVRTAYLDQFKIGERTLLDLLDSENEAYESGRAYTEALYSEYKAVIRLLAGSGKLAEFLSVTRSDFNVAEAISLSESVFDPQHVCPAESTDVMAPQTNILVRDSDEDGVTELWDECPGTPPGKAVDASGCVLEASADMQNEMPNISDGSLMPVHEALTPEQTIPTGSSPTELEKFSITFKSNSSYLDARSIAKLNVLLSLLENDPDLYLTVEGHASLIGENDYNKWLSERRAKSVFVWLLANTTASEIESRISLESFGEELPIVNDMSEEASALNRRTEIVLSRQPKGGD